MSDVYDPRTVGIPGPTMPAPMPSPGEEPSQDIADVKEFIDKAFEIHGYNPMPYIIEKLITQTTLELALGNPGIAIRIEVELEDVSAVTTTRRIKLGTHNLPNQSRTHKHGDYDYRFETRSAWLEAYADVSHPSLNDFINDAVECARGAATAAVLTAIYTESPAAGYALFWPAFKACMYSKIGNRVSQLNATLGYTTETGCWKNHC